MNEDQRYERQEQAWKMLENVAGQVKEIHNTIYVGNGKPSLMVRLDRLEQRTKVMWGAAVAMVGKIVHLSLG